MMKIFKLILIPAVLLLNAEAFAKINLSGDYVVLGFVPLAAKIWSQLEEKYHPTGDVRASVTTLEEAKRSHFYAQTLGDTLFINPNVSPSVQMNAFAHELRHVYLNIACGKSIQSSPLIHEVFAQWESGDYLTISSSQNQFVYRSHAKKWLSENYKSFNSKNYGLAISRLLSVPGKRKDINLFFRNLISTCKKEVSIGALELKLAHLLQFSPATKSSAEGLSFALFDALAGQTIAHSGNPSFRDRVGSALKPLAFVLSPKFFESRLSQNNLTWACPNINDISRIRSWSWSEALSKSCNGFFLDVDVNDDSSFHKSWSEYRSKTRIVDLPSKITVNQLVGLIDGIKLSLSDLIRTYLYISEKNMDVLYALKDTPISGTVASYPEASWFAQNNILLKTGSVRSENGAPEVAVMVAIGLDDSMKRVRFISAIREQGVSTKKLSRDLYKRLVPYIELTKEIKVQILGLVTEEELKFDCDLLLTSNDLVKWKIISDFKFTNNSYYKCSNEGVRVQVPFGRGIRTTHYRGIIEYNRPSESIDNKKRHITKKMHRARRGSSFILHTSLYDYLTNTLSAEFPNGKSETLKALAVASYVNVLSNRHGDRPICDTTHCQVLVPFANLPLSKKNRIEKALIDVFSDQKYKNYLHQKWMPFYLGGEGEWRRSISSRDIQRKINIDAPIDNFEIKNESISVMSSGKEASFSCEYFRNQLGLNSCPSEVQRIDGKIWSFQGKGEGHGIGMALSKANIMASRGEKYTDILKAFYSD